MKRVVLRDVSVRFGKVAALTSMSTTVSSGEIVMLVGPNGAGKSTFMRVLLGLVRPERGELEIDGAVVRVDNAFKARLGYLPEAVAFSDNLSGEQVLRFFAMARGVSRARVGEVLSRVGLAQASRRRVGGYSRGMRQRLGLGVAILSEPELLILDEPTGGLDQEGLVVLYSVLNEWRDKGRMVLMATHDIAMLERRVDRMCVFRSGCLVADGSPSTLRREAGLPLKVTMTLASGGGAEVEAFVAAIGEWEGGSGEVRDGALHAEVASGELLGLMDLRGRHVGAVVDLRVEEPTLDVVYEKLLAEG